MAELNTEKNIKKTIKSTKSIKNNKISIEDDIDDMADKYNNMEITEKKINKIECDKIKDIIYVGEIIKKDNGTLSKWKLDYKCSKEIMSKENGRIYFIVIDKEIYKIGSSACKGGIKNTFGFYEGGLGGSPSIRTFGIHMLIQEKLNENKSIYIYMLFINEIKTKIRGIISEIEKITYPQIKEMEDLCREDYKKIYGKYPQWNFQENVEEWPMNIKNKYKEQVNNRGKTNLKEGK